jgi:hypothetical protein
VLRRRPRDRDPHRAALSRLDELLERARHRWVIPHDPQAAAPVIERRSLLVNGLTGVGALAGTRALAGAGALAGAALGAGVLGLVERPAYADTVSDIQVGQTAAAIENLAVGLYSQAAAQPFLTTMAAPAGPTILIFLFNTAAHHVSHAKAFNDAVVALGGREQKAADVPLAESLVKPGLSALKAPVDVLRLAAEFERVAAASFAAATVAVADKTLRTTFSSIVGVESQHQAVLLAMAALLDGNDARLVAVPTQASALPAAIGSAGIPEAQLSLKDARPPTEGAQR